MRYRIREFNPLKDIYILERHVFWFWWSHVDMGTKSQVEEFIKDNNV